MKIIRGETQDVDTLSFIKPQRELEELLIQVHDVNVHHIFDHKVKKKFFQNAEFIQDCLLDEEEARIKYEKEKNERRRRGECFLEDISTESIVQFAFIKAMTIQQRELENAERFRSLNPALESFR